MKVVILAGGLGTRISEESILKPKPMIEVAGKPILWHIMKIYSFYGINEFIICCGYKGYLIKEYFANYFLHNSDVTIDITKNEIEVHLKKSEPWKVTLIDTGQDTQTGGRLLRIKDYVDDDFCMTYGDGVADINIEKLIKYHKNHGKLATMTVVSPPGRFGSVKLDKDKVERFLEKPTEIENEINGGFFVLKPEALEFINGDLSIWERDPLEQLALKNELMAFSHKGFWQPMDTPREKKILEDLFLTGKAPWKIWN